MKTFLGAVFLLFIGILAFIYEVARRTDPVILDAKGNVRSGTYR